MLVQHSNTKANKYSSCYLFLSLLGQVVYFHEALLLYYLSIICMSHFLQLLAKFFKIGVLLKTFRNPQETPVSEFHFNQPVACYFFNKRLRHRCFLVNFAKLSRTPFLQTTLGLLLLYFFGHICNITKFSLFTKVTFPTI